jgi:hypothetical protein
VRVENNLPHVRYVEETCRGPGMEMFPQNPGGVLNWHVIAGEMDHTSTIRQMKSMQWQLLHRCSRRAYRHAPILLCHTGWRDILEVMTINIPGR